MDLNMKIDITPTEIQRSRACRVSFLMCFIAACIHFSRYDENANITHCPWPSHFHPPWRSDDIRTFRAQPLAIFGASRKVQHGTCNSDRHTFGDDSNDISAPFAGSTSVGYGNFMHIGSESRADERRASERNENNPERIFRVDVKRGGTRWGEMRRDEVRWGATRPRRNSLVEFRYNVNGSRLLKEAPSSSRTK